MYNKIFIGNFTKDNKAIALIAINEKIICKGLFNFENSQFSIGWIKPNLISKVTVYAICDVLRDQDWSEHISVAYPLCRDSLLIEYLKLWKMGKPLKKKKHKCN